MIHSLAEFLFSWLASPPGGSPVVRLFPPAGRAPGVTESPSISPLGSGVLPWGGRPGAACASALASVGEGALLPSPGAGAELCGFGSLRCVSRPHGRRDIARCPAPALRGRQQPRASESGGCPRQSRGGGGEHCQNLARACLPRCRWHQGCTGRVTSLAAVPGTHGLPTLTTAARWGGLGAGAREPAKELPYGWATPRRLRPLAQPRCGGAGRAALAWASRRGWQRERRQAALCAGAIDSGSQRKWDQ